MRFKVEIKGDKEIAHLLSRIPKEKKAEAKAAVGDIALKIQARAKTFLRAEKAMDTGNLANSILAEFSPTAIEAEIGSTAKYAPYVEFGAGPAVGHKRFFPPMEALESWARHHGFDSAWPVCKIIWERGLRPRPFLGPAYDDFKGELLIRLQRIMGKKWE